MTRYVLGVRRAGAQTDEAVSCRTARSTIEAIEAWREERGTVTVILRAGKPITEFVLRRDVARERRAVEARC